MAKRVSETGRGEFYLFRTLGCVKGGKTGPTPLFLSPSFTDFLSTYDGGSGDDTHKTCPRPFMPIVFKAFHQPRNRCYSYLVEEVASITYIFMKKLRLGEELKLDSGHATSERQKRSLNPGLAMFFAPVQADKELAVFKARSREMSMGS